MKGVSCATGVALRFCYSSACGNSAGRGSTAPPAATHQVLSIDLAGSSDDTGYMLFPAPGAYRLSAAQAGHPLGSVVMVVRGR